MTPNRVLFLGCDKGAWQMRGRQLAEVLGARYAGKPLASDIASAEVIILVKRAAETFAPLVQGCDARLIWDVLDVWRQPEANDRPKAEHIQQIRDVQRMLGIRTLIGATKAMAKAIGGLYLPHHSRIGLVPTPPRPRVEVVGYDGSPRYLGSWRGALEAACGRLGLRFVLNPEDLSTVDLLVAFRGEEWDGWVCRQWKSGVKYVNAIAAGRPIVTQSCAAFHEIRPAAGVAVLDPAELVDALHAMSMPVVRKMAYEDGLDRAEHFTREAIANTYRALITQVARGAA